MGTCIKMYFIVIWNTLKGSNMFLISLIHLLFNWPFKKVLFLLYVFLSPPLTSQYSIRDCTSLLQLHNKYHSLGGLNNRNLYFSFGGWEVQDEGTSQVGLFSGLFSWLIGNHILLCDHISFSLCASRENRSELSCGSFYKVTNLIKSGPHPYNLI